MSTTLPDRSRTRRRKIRAVLAGGLVLGVGAAVTLATWNDSEFAEGAFAAGTFNLEGSTDGAAYAEHPTADEAAGLTFSVSSQNLSPGDAVSAPFAVRLDDETSYDATVALDSAATTGAVSELTYALTTSSTFGCSGTVGETLVPAGTALGADISAATFDLAAGADTSPGDPVFLCFTVTAGDGLVQGSEGSATWEFLATSTED